jgi:tetrahydromethanopterin S-methyltransferase subunit G
MNIQSLGQNTQVIAEKINDVLVNKLTELNEINKRLLELKEEMEFFKL